MSKRKAGPGRPPGSPNVLSGQLKKDVREIAQGLVMRPAYLAQIEKKLDDGTLHPSIQVLLWQFAYGKPKETVDIKLPVALKIVHEFAAKPAVSGEIIDATPQRALPSKS